MPVYPLQWTTSIQVEAVRVMTGILWLVQTGHQDKYARWKTLIFNPPVVSVNVKTVSAITIARTNSYQTITSMPKRQIRTRSRATSQHQALKTQVQYRWATEVERTTAMSQCLSIESNKLRTCELISVSRTFHVATLKKSWKMRLAGRTKAYSPLLKSSLTRRNPKRWRTWATSSLNSSIHSLS